jgi:radical SAM additional 4Fe4S-binding domain
LDRGPMDRTEKIEGDFKNCHYRNFVLALGADGCLYPCPQIHLNDKYCMGNVIKEGYENWINSGKKEEWFENNSDRRELCKTCFYRPQNELLECIVNGKLNLDEVLSEYEENHRDTLHADFV